MTYDQIAAGWLLAFIILLFAGDIIEDRISRLKMWLRPAPSNQRLDHPISTGEGHHPPE